MGWPFLARRKGFEPLRSLPLRALLRSFHPLRSKNASRFEVRGSMPLTDIQKSRHPMRGIGILARRKGFEPLTFWSVARRSIQLS